MIDVSGIGYEGIGDFFYDEKKSNLVAEQVSAALNEIQMENPGIHFTPTNRGFIPQIRSRVDNGLIFDGGRSSIEFENLDDGAVKINGSLAVFSKDDPINPIFSSSKYFTAFFSQSLLGYASESIKA